MGRSKQSALVKNSKAFGRFLKKYYKRIILSVANGTLMLLMTFLWIRLVQFEDYESGIYKDIISAEDKIKTNSRQEKFKNRFLFIDTSESMEIYDDSISTPARTNRDELLK